RRRGPAGVSGNRRRPEGRGAAERSGGRGWSEPPAAGCALAQPDFDREIANQNVVFRSPALRDRDFRKKLKNLPPPSPPATLSPVQNVFPEPAGQWAGPPASCHKGR